MIGDRRVRTGSEAGLGQGSMAAMVMVALQILRLEATEQ